LFDFAFSICYNIIGEQGQFFCYKIKGLLVSGNEHNCSLLTTLNEVLFILEIIMFNQKEYDKQWLKDNPEYMKQYYLNHKKEIDEHDKQYYIDNKEKIKERMRQYYINNKESFLKKVKSWRLSNKEKMKEYNKQYVKNKRKTDLKYNLGNRMSIAIGKSLKGNKAGRKWETLVGYTVNDLIKHLKKTMPKGYCWQDYIEAKLHLDHIIPKSIFTFDRPKYIDFKRCWALNNLQLLPAKENLIKNAKLTRPFQLALKI